MIIQTVILVFMGVIATLVALLVGLLSYVALKLMKKELNLKITIGQNPPKKTEG